MDYRIVEGAEQIRPEEAAALLHGTYWAEKRPMELIEKSMRNSACYGVVSEEDTGSPVSPVNIIRKGFRTDNKDLLSPSRFNKALRRKES